MAEEVQGFGPFIVSEIGRGRLLASEFNAEYIACLQQDIPYKHKKTFMSLLRVLKALDFKMAKDTLDDIAIALYNRMITLIGKKPTVAEIKWGFYSDHAPDPNTMMFQHSDLVVKGVDSYTLDFGEEVLSSDKWVAFSEPISEPLKIKWWNTEFNQGLIPDAAMLPPVIVGDRRITISRGIFIFDSRTTKLTIAALGANDTFTYILPSPLA